MIVLSMLALMLSDKYSKRSRFLEILNGLNEFSSKIEETLKLDEEVKKIAQTWTRILLVSIVSLSKKACNDPLLVFVLQSERQSVLIMGRGYNFGSCLEGARKIKEVSAMHSEGILSGELKHGPLALIDETQPIDIGFQNR